VRNNICYVKFLDKLIEDVKLIPHKLLSTKKHVNLFMEVNQKSVENNSFIKTTLNKFQPDPSLETIKNYPEVATRLSEIRPKT